MDLGDYLNNFYFRTFFLSKPVQKRLAAALPGAVAAESGAQTRSAAEIGAARLREEGANFRTGLTTKAQKELEELGQAGETSRLGMRIKGAMDLQKSGYDFDVGKMRLQDKLASDFLDMHRDDLSGGESRSPNLSRAITRHLTSPSIPDTVASPGADWSDEDESALNSRWKEKSKKREWSTDEYLGF